MRLHVAGLEYDDSYTLRKDEDLCARPHPLNCMLYIYQEGFAL